jgi:hypothetical protein
MLMAPCVTNMRSLDYLQQQIIPMTTSGDAAPIDRAGRQ